MSTEAIATDAPAGASEFAHMLLKVSDVERSRHFYVDLLGFKVRPAKGLLSKPSRLSSASRNGK